MVRVEASGALAEQRGRGKGRGRLTRCELWGKAASQSASKPFGARLMVGRPVLPRRKCRSESDAPSQNSGTGAVPAAPVPDQKPRNGP